MTYIGEFHYKVVSVRFFRSMDNIFKADALQAIPNVLLDRQGKENRLLSHHADLVTQPTYVESPNVNVIEGYLNYNIVLKNKPPFHSLQINFYLNKM